MKSISINAVHRVGQFLNSRKAQYDPEEWSPQDAVQDLLWGSSREFSDSLGRVFHNATEVLLNALSSELPALLDEFSKEFDAQVGKAVSQASAEGLPIPDDDVLQELKSRYLEDMQAALVHGVSDIQPPDFEGDELIHLFRDASGSGVVR